MENETTDIRTVIAANITELRKKSGMTQLELAESLNYTDKAVSKWERGESIPDVVILKRIAELFGVTVDYLLNEEHEETAAPFAPPGRRRKRTHALITEISVGLVWLIATVAFVVCSGLNMPGAGVWLAFVYAVPASSVVWLVFNSVWFDRHRNYLIISLLMWSLIASVHLTLLYADLNLWMLYLLGVPGEVIIVIWSRIGKKK